MAAGRTLARWVGAAVTDDQAAMIGFRVHRALGMTYGAGAALLMESHLRGVVGHAVYGVALGAMLAVASRLRALGRTS
jgi:hypothetical protein